VLAGFIDEDNEAAVPRATIEAWEQEGLVKYLGSFDDMVPVYAQADCVVLPSYYREGVPRSLLEAASMGKPVITTNSVGCRDTVEDGVTGWLVGARDAGGLAARMHDLIASSPERRHAMSIASTERMKRDFDEKNVLAAYGRKMSMPQQAQSPLEIKVSASA